MYVCVSVCVCVYVANYCLTVTWHVVQSHTGLQRTRARVRNLLGAPTNTMAQLEGFTCAKVRAL